MQADFLKKAPENSPERIGTACRHSEGCRRLGKPDTGIYKTQQVRDLMRMLMFVQDFRREIHGCLLKGIKWIFRRSFDRPVSITKVQPYSAQYDWTF